MSQTKQQGQKWAHLRKYYINCGWTSDIKIWMADVQGGHRKNWGHFGVSDFCT